MVRAGAALLSPPGPPRRVAIVEWRLLEGVPGEEVRRLLSVARRRSFRRGEVVFHRGDPADSLHLVSKGRFKVQVMTPLGDQATVAIRGPGDSFGEMAVVGAGAKRSATVEALEAGETFCVIESEFARLRRVHEGVNQLLIDFLANEVRMLNERLLEALYVPADRRIVRRLAELAGLYRGTDGEAVIPLTQDALAELAGTSRPTVNQVLRSLQEKGLVELGRGKTVVLDVEALAGRER
jgi:CRP-like cAMP-binding protein